MKFSDGLPDGDHCNRGSQPAIENWSTTRLALNTDGEMLCSKANHGGWAFELVDLAIWTTLYPV